MPARQVPLRVIAAQWTRIGCIGFGGPPAHIVLLRALCVEREGWLSAAEFEDGVAATSLLPGPASTQLAIFCAWRLAGLAGALIGGACFIVPGLILILAASTVVLAAHPPLWVSGAAAGAGSAVPVVAVAAALGLVPASWRRAGTATAARARWVSYLFAGAAASILAGSAVVLVLLAAGLAELAARGQARRPRPRPGPEGPHPGRDGPRPPRRPGRGPGALTLMPLLPAVTAGTLLSVAWVAFKVGALSFGGGFVIIPLMQRDAVHTYHWMTGAQFLSAVALGQITPGPVVQTVSVIGFAAAGLGGGLLAALVAFAPSFAFVLAGGPHFDSLRSSPRAQAFLTGAGPAAIGAIAGSSVPLGMELAHLWQLGLLAVAAGWLIGLRKGVVTTITGAAVVGVVAVLAGAPA
jgi:chromate transporter